MLTTITKLMNLRKTQWLKSIIEAEDVYNTRGSEALRLTIDAMKWYNYSYFLFKHNKTTIEAYEDYYKTMTNR